MFAFNPSRSNLLTYMAVYPFLMRGLYLLRQSFEPFYMNSTCLMDFVRISAPEHYALHPLWKFYQAGSASNQTCEDITGMPIEDFFRKTYYSGTFEYKIYFSAIVLYVGISLMCFLRQVFTGKVKSIMGVVAIVGLAWNIFSLLHLLAHYQNDLHHLNGNVMHHSSFSVNGDSATLVNTLPPGLIINFSLNFFMVWMMSYVVLDYFKVDTWVYLNLAGPVMFGKLFFTLKVIHPYIHAQRKSWWGPLVATYWSDEFKGHVLCHHVNGYCLGDSPTFSWFYDRMMHLHGMLYEKEYLVFGQFTHYVFNYLLDYILLATVLVFMVLTVLLFYPFLIKAEKGKEQSEKSQKTAVDKNKVKQG